MQILGQLMRHVRLVAGMAKSTETDLVGAVQAGDITHHDWAEMVQTCRKCNWVGNCTDWLATHQKADSAPGACLNQSRFTALKTKESQRTKQVVRT